MSDPSGISRHQTNTATELDRYPRIFRRVREHFLSLPDQGQLNILSFGCSSGEEVETLSRFYFPNARILGLDVNEQVLNQARERGLDPTLVRFELSSKAALAENGPFDIIFAMSVFCLWPDTQGKANITDLYTFDKFVEGVSLLHSHLEIGGLLVVVNANYRFKDLPFAGQYSSLDVNIPASGFVEQFDRDGNRIHEPIPPDCIFRRLG